jgi:hypothetical protein
MKFSGARSFGPKIFLWEEKAVSAKLRRDIPAFA